MKKSVLIPVILGVIVIIAVAGFFLFGHNLYSNSGNASGGNNTGEVTTILHKDFHASIDATWMEIESSPSLYIYLPPNTSPEDVRAEGIIITSTPVTNTSQTLDQLLADGLNRSRIIMPDLELTETSDYTNGKLTGKEIKFTGTQEGVKRNNDQIFGIKNNILYVIDYTCPIDSCNYDSVFENVAQSFEPVQSAK